MYKVKIFSIGKTKESFLEPINEYVKRLSPLMSIEWLLFRKDEEMARALNKETYFIALDSLGKEFSSEGLSNFFSKALLQNGSKLSFVIGGSEGLPPQIKKKSSFVLSFSSLTFPHQLVRLILLEQLYRSMQIHQGKPYHK